MLLSSYPPSPNGMWTFENCVIINWFSTIYYIYNTAKEHIDYQPLFCVSLKIGPIPIPNIPMDPDFPLFLSIGFSIRNIYLKNIYMWRLEILHWPTWKMIPADPKSPCTCCSPPWPWATSPLLRHVRSVRRCTKASPGGSGPRDGTHIES